MAIRQRNKDTQLKDTGVSNVGKSEDLKKESSKKTNAAYDIPDVRSFRLQAIQVLNILDAQGINIYDETRTPGMYLSRKNNVSSNLVQNILNGENSLDNTNVSKTNSNDSDTKPPVSFNLLKALINNNN